MMPIHGERFVMKERECPVCKRRRWSESDAEECCGERMIPVEER